MNFIGEIRSPFKDPVNMPIQPVSEAAAEGKIIIQPQYVEGLKDLEGFSHLFLIYLFHQAKRVELTVVPFMDHTPRGVFATRSPLRPNHIGLSIVTLVSLHDNILHISGCDILDGTPLLDIKPYIEQFDRVDGCRNGWLSASAADIAQKRSDSRFT